MRAAPFTEGGRRYVAVAHFDVTERVEYRARLEESNRQLEEFASALAHDLREPLRMVTNYLELLEHRYGDDFDEEADEFVAFAVDAAERMQAMVEGLLTYSRIDGQDTSFGPVDLGDVVADVVRDLGMRIDEADTEITVEPLPTVRGDASQLRQVFQNLLDNAIEYSGDEPPRVAIDAERAGDECVVSVSDEGIGIDPTDADRVFDIFQRLHTNEEHEGTGIGLALCERIVDRHGGDIWVDSDPGDGTTFSFTLAAGRQRDD